MPTETTTRFSAPQVLLSWEAPTRKFETKSKLWFIGLVVLCVGIFVALTIFNEFLLGVLVLSFGTFLFVQSSVTPPQVKHSIYTSGFQMAGKTYLWDELESFFIDKNDNGLILKTSLSFPNELVVYLDEKKQAEIEETLLNYLPYVEMPRTDYSSILDGFIGQFSQKLPSKFTKRFVSKPEQKMTLEPDMDKITETLSHRPSLFKRKTTEKKQKKTKK